MARQCCMQKHLGHANNFQIVDCSENLTKFVHAAIVKKWSTESERLALEVQGIRMIHNLNV